MNKKHVFKNWLEKWAGTITLLISLIAAIYVGWWVIFIKPVYIIVTTTALKWSSLGVCILRFIIGDFVTGIIFTVGTGVSIIVESIMDDKKTEKSTKESVEKTKENVEDEGD